MALCAEGSGWSASYKGEYRLYGELMEAMRASRGMRLPMFLALWVL
jgi:hypothetical protein